MIEFNIENKNDLKQVAGEILNLTKEFNIVCFYGSMGSGKTTLIKKICNEAEVIDFVNSPTFSIVNEYYTNSNQKIYHFDFYRLDKIEQAKEIGVEEYLDSGNLCLIEWPEKIEALLPHSIMKIDIDVLINDTRKISITIPKN
jgi:tRNA threonylcarbamoyladenosine biosynthesis protein TsaE